jgi:hypothetical protein
LQIGQLFFPSLLPPFFSFKEFCRPPHPHLPSKMNPFTAQAAAASIMSDFIVYFHQCLHNAQENEIIVVEQAVANFMANDPRMPQFSGPVLLIIFGNLIEMGENIVQWHAEDDHAH